MILETARTDDGKITPMAGRDGPAFFIVQVYG